MIEKCEACGRFGARKGIYRHYNQSLGKTCVAYLCPRCEKLQRKADIIEGEIGKTALAQQDEKAAK